ncbi:MAG: polyhydroxyalkanoic acid system family protein [Pirellulales bacterium]|nr:polyhydroxyalkanoic acid system family protein [Pirellulales bacterium]
MPKLNLEIPHQLSAEEAKERLQRFTEALESKFKDQVSDLQQSWQGDDLAFGFKTFGINIQGQIHVREEKLVLDGELPFSAMMFKGKIESEIRQQLERLVR